MSTQVECSQDYACDGDHHGWGCGLAAPLADVRRYIPNEPLANPLLESVRQDLLATWLPEHLR